MKKLIDINSILLVGSIIAVVIIGLKQFILNDIPEWFSFGEELGELMYDASIGYLVTYWFYYLTVYRVEKKRSERATDFVRIRIISIVRDTDNLLSAMYKRDQNMLEFLTYPDSESLKNEEALDFVLCRLNLQSFYSTSKHSFLNVKWWEKLRHFAIDTKKSIEEMQYFLTDLDSDVKQLVVDLSIHEYINIMTNLYLHEEEYIENTSHSMYEFIILTNQLNERLK